jgi:uncharacterized coiled-coil protein SlyX
MCLSVASAQESADDETARLEQLQRAIAEQRATIAEQSRQLDEQRRVLESQRRLLDRQQRELEELLARAGAETAPQARLPAVSQGPAPPQPKAPTPVAPQPAPEVAQEAEPPAPVAPKPPVAQGEAPPPAPPRPVAPGEAPEPEAPEPTQRAEAPSAEEERPESEKPLEQLLVEAGGVLLPPGMLQLEPSFEFQRYSDSAVAISGFSIFDAILIGSFSVDRLDRDIWQWPVTVRYGLLNRLQLEARVPLVYREDQEVIGVGTATSLDRSTSQVNVGDTEVALLWQGILGRRFLPNVIFNARARFPTGEHTFEIPQFTLPPPDETGNELVRLKRPPTGSGFYSVAPGFTAIWRADPAVFFVGSNYTWNFERKFGSDVGKINPGNTLDGFVGVNLSVSERLALNFTFQDSYTWSTERNGDKAPGSHFNDGRLSVGASLGLTPQTSLLVNATAGLTEQSPDFVFSIRVPMTFALPPIFGR